MPAVSMRQNFLSEHNGLASENDRLIGVDWQSPDRVLAELEEPEDDATDLDVLALKGIPTDALLTLLRFLLPQTAYPKKRWRLLQMRFAVLAHEAGLPGVANLPYAQLAEELDCTRALLSVYACRLTDALGLAQVRGGKSRQARESYRQSATESHQRRGNKHHDEPQRRLEPFKTASTSDMA